MVEGDGVDARCPALVKIKHGRQADLEHVRSEAEHYRAVRAVRRHDRRGEPAQAAPSRVSGRELEQGGRAATVVSPNGSARPCWAAPRGARVRMALTDPQSGRSGRHSLRWSGGGGAGRGARFGRSSWWFSERAEETGGNTFPGPKQDQRRLDQRARRRAVRRSRPRRPVTETNSRGM